MNVHRPPLHMSVERERAERPGEGTLHDRTAKILVVTDERAARTGLVRTLTQAGHQAETAENGQAALARLRNEHYDVLLTDLTVEATKPFEVLRFGHKRCPHLLIIVRRRRGR
jgi:DNA-binding NtrC family response regulator